MFKIAINSYKKATHQPISKRIVQNSYKSVQIQSHMQLSFTNCSFCSKVSPG